MEGHLHQILVARIRTPREQITKTATIKRPIAKSQRHKQEALKPVTLQMLQKRRARGRIIRIIRTIRMLKMLRTLSEQIPKRRIPRGQTTSQQIPRHRTSRDPIPNHQILRPQTSPEQISSHGIPNRLVHREPTFKCIFRLRTFTSAPRPEPLQLLSGGLLGMREARL